MMQVRGLRPCHLRAECILLIINCFSVFVCNMCGMWLFCISWARYIVSLCFERLLRGRWIQVLSPAFPLQQRFCTLNSDDALVEVLSNTVAAELLQSACSDWRCVLCSSYSWIAERKQIDSFCFIILYGLLLVLLYILAEFRENDECFGSVFSWNLSMHKWTLESTVFFPLS